MLLGLVYSCLRLLLRHELRVLRRQIKRPQLRPADRLIMAAFHRDRTPKTDPPSLRVPRF